jgi:hypothetical protein
MDKLDWELLDKQIRSPQPEPPPNDVMQNRPRPRNAVKERQAGGRR